MVIFVLTESTPNAEVAPASAATTAREEAYASGIHSDQLRHGGERSTGWTITTEPALFIAPFGEDFDDKFVFPPGMVLVLEPVVWKDGTGGYRSEEIVVITEDGYLPITDYPYSPYGD